MSTLQSELVTNEALAFRVFSHSLDLCVIRNAGHISRVLTRVMATAVEAIVGAVFKDSSFDLEAVCAVMARLGFFSYHLFTKTNCDSLVGGILN